MNKTATAMFYLIWRNVYLRGLLQGFVLRDTVITFKSIDALEDNHHFLSVLPHDRTNYKSMIRLMICNSNEFNQYINNPLSVSLVNDLCLCKKDLSIKQQPVQPKTPTPSFTFSSSSFPLSTFTASSSFANSSFSSPNQVVESPSIDCNLLPDTLHRLELLIDENTTLIGRLPESLRDLTIKCFSLSRFENKFIDTMLCNLPKDLESLTLPSYFIPKYEDITVFTLPKSLSYFSYRGNPHIIKRFRPAPNNNNVFPQCRLLVQSRSDLEWVADQTWINNILIIGASFTIASFAPSHIRHLELFHVISPLEKDFLPPLLESLHVDGYTLPLKPDVLPSQLKELSLNSFDDQLVKGALPLSLTKLSLAAFNKPLDAFIIPARVQDLNLSKFSYPFAKDILPPSLTKLCVGTCVGHPDSIAPLHQLQKLNVETLNQQAVRLIGSKSVDVEFRILGVNVCFNQNTSIERLCLFNNGPTISMHVDSLPPTLRRLKTFKIDLQESDKLEQKKCSYNLL